MATKIYLSPSDQWANIVADGAHSEAYHCTQIAKSADKYLKANGYSVKIGNNSKQGTYPERVRESNSWGADVHVCIHTNAGGGKGTEVLCWPSSKNDKYVKCVYNRVAMLTPSSDRGIRTNSSLYEIVNTKAMCVYVECDFHDDKSIENWIDAHTDDIGKAIAQGVCQADGKPFKTPASTSSNTGKLYAVQVGAYEKKANAENQAKKLKKEGFDSYIYKDGNLYKVQTGAYEKKANADALVKKLKAKGYSTYITRK